MLQQNPKHASYCRRCHHLACGQRVAHVNIFQRTPRERRGARLKETRGPQKRDDGTETAACRSPSTLAEYRPKLERQGHLLLICSRYLLTKRQPKVLSVTADVEVGLEERTSPGVHVEKNSKESVKLTCKEPERQTRNQRNPLT